MLKLVGKVRIFENKSKKGKFYFSTTIGSKNKNDVWENFNCFVNLDEKVKPKWQDKDDYSYADVVVKDSYVNFTVAENEKGNMIDTVNIFIFEVEEENEKPNKENRRR